MSRFSETVSFRRFARMRAMDSRRKALDPIMDVVKTIRKEIGSILFVLSAFPAGLRTRCSQRSLELAAAPSQQDQCAFHASQSVFHVVCADLAAAGLQLNRLGRLVLPARKIDWWANGTAGQQA